MESSDIAQDAFDDRVGRFPGEEVFRADVQNDGVWEGSFQFAVADAPEQVLVAVADEAHIEDAVLVEEGRVELGWAGIGAVAIPVQAAPTMDDAVADDDDIGLDDKVAVAEDHRVPEMPVVAAVVAAFGVKSVSDGEVVRVVERGFDPAFGSGAALDFIAEDAGELEVGDDRAVSSDRDPGDGVHDAIAKVIADDAAVKAASSRADHVIVFAVPDSFDVIVPVSAEDGVVQGIDVTFKGEPLIAGPVDRHVHEDESPARVLVVTDDLSRPGVLFVGDALHRQAPVTTVHGIKADEMAFLVEEIVVCAFAEALLPDALGDIVREAVSGPAEIDVMVADNVVEAHVQGADEGFQFVPLRLQALFRCFFVWTAVSSFDEVSD